MLVQDLISYSMRVAGILGVGQSPLAQDTSDATTALINMLKQWRQKRWLVFRLDNVTFPLSVGKGNYTVGPYYWPPDSNTPNAVDVVTNSSNYRPAGIESAYLRQVWGGAPGSYPIDYPVRKMRSRQEFDAIALKQLTSWPGAYYYDPTIPNATLMIWPIPMQNFFEFYVGFQQAIDFAPESSAALELDNYLPAEAEEALIYNLAVRLMINYRLPMDQGIVSAAKAGVNTLRQANTQISPLQMPIALQRQVRVKNPMAGFYPEVSTGVPFTVLS